MDVFTPEKTSTWYVLFWDISYHIDIKWHILGYRTFVYRSFDVIYLDNSVYIGYITCFIVDMLRHLMPMLRYAMLRQGTAGYTAHLAQRTRY